MDLRKARLTLLSMSKAERGYHLADGTLPAAHEPGVITVDPDLPLQQAFSRLADGLIDQLLANQPAALRGDELEGIHQMRVAIRRLRSLLMLFDRFLEPHASERFNDELRRLGQVLGEARDWDVFVTEALPQAAEHRRARAWIDPLRRPALERQHAAHQAVKKARPGTGLCALHHLVSSLERRRRRHPSAGAEVPADQEGRAPDGRAPRPQGRAAPRRPRSRVHRRPARPSQEPEEVALQPRILSKPVRQEGRDLHPKRCNKLQKRLGRINDLGNLVRHASELAANQRLDLVPALGILGRRSEALIAKEMKGLPKALRKFPRQPAFLA